MTEASEDFGGVTWNGQKQWGHRSHPWCSMVRGAGWKICPEEKDVNWNFELPCYWQRHRWTPFCCHRYRASWWNQNHRTPKKCGTTKITKERYFGPKKRVWMCENCAPGFLDQESLQKSFPFLWQGYAKVAVLGRDVVYVKLEELLEKNLAVWVASDLDFFSKFVANIVLAMLSFMESDILAMRIRWWEIISFSLVCVYEQTPAHEWDGEKIFAIDIINLVTIPF